MGSVLTDYLQHGHPAQITTGTTLYTSMRHRSKYGANGTTACFPGLLKVTVYIV